MAVAIVAAMLFVVIDPIYDFLGEYVVWIVITVGETYPPSQSTLGPRAAKNCTLHALSVPTGHDSFLIERYCLIHNDYLTSVRSGLHLPSCG